MTFLAQQTAKQEATRAAVLEWLAIRAGILEPRPENRFCCMERRNEDTGDVFPHHKRSMEHIATIYDTTEQEMYNDLNIYLPYQQRLGLEVSDVLSSLQDQATQPPA